MTALDFAAAVAEWERAHPEYAAAKRAWLQAEKEHRAYCDSLLPQFEPRPLVHCSTWGKRVGKRRYG